jgi:glutamate 5-kinase
VCIAQLIADSRKIVIKIGSSTLAAQDGTVNTAFLDGFSAGVATLLKKNKQVVIVSSGAQIAGLSILKKWSRKRDIHYRQALCAVGQVELMRTWSQAFAKHGLHIGQILLTRDDFDDSSRTLHMRNTLFTLVDEGIIPIINENDTVCVDEIKIGDNDTLAAQSAVLWSADLLIILSDIDGLYTKNPKEFPDAQILTEVYDLSSLHIALGTPGAFGTGGIATKLSAAEQVLSYGIPLVLTNGSSGRILESLAEGTQQATLFLAAAEKSSADPN